MPNKDKRYELELVKAERRRPGERPKPSASERPTPEPTPEPAPEPERPHSVQDGDLKNPFGR
ncbi:MAG TPA: hypothetical protein VM869_00050 [Enhygromyxa sp.]|nr:hypothetical protein [Enhygromyxa sp.]